MRHRIILLLLVIPSLATVVYSQQQLAGRNTSGGFSPNEVLTLHPSPVAGIVIDGVIEDAWKSGAHFDNWVENWPIERREPLAQTEGYVTYDEDNLYFAFICHDPHMEALRANLSDRDKIWQDDFVGINIDPFGQQQTSYEFFVNPLGIQGDIIVNHGGNGEDASFDAVWESEAKIYDAYWTVEMRIPFKSLRYPKAPLQDWLLHMHRIHPRETRYRYSWMPVTQDKRQFAQAGHLKMDQALSTSRAVEVLPYVIGSRTGSLNENTNGLGRWSRATDGDFGIGVKYGLSSNLTLDGAYNPDFSQIESDAGQVDINNTFALFFPEKRPFFLEGSDIFFVDADANLIYTRSINNPLLATKLTGKVGRTTIGMVSALDENATFLVPFEEGSETVVSSRNAWNQVARLKYDFGDQRYIGLMATDRHVQAGGSNSVAAFDSYWSLSERYALKLLASYSYTKEPSDSLLESDRTFKTGGKTYTGTFDGESFDGLALKAGLSYNSKQMSYWASYNDFSPGYRADNGFVTGNHTRVVSAWWQYYFRFDQHPILTQVQPQLFTRRVYNYDGKLKDFGIRPQFYVEFKKQTGMYGGALVVNNENFGGKQFNHMYRADVGIDTRPSRALAGGTWVESGNYINRRGREGDIYNPFIVGKGLAWNSWFEVKPTSQSEVEVNLKTFRLWAHYGGDLIRRQEIVRGTLSYQFSRRWFLRLIGEVTWIERNSTQTDDNDNFQYDLNGQPILDRVKKTFLSLDPLVSYKINPFTVFFLGAHIGGESDPYDNYDGLTRTAQSVFVKFQYFMRL